MLVIDGLRTRYCLTEPLSFRVTQGEMVAVIGPNGAGKTTLIRAMSAQLNLEAGHVHISNRRLSDLSSRERSQILALVNQYESKPQGFTLKQFVEMGRYSHRSAWSPLSDKDRQVVELSLKRAHVWPLRKRLITALSGGEYQRARIARALAQEPQLLILDEPMAHLDIAHRHQVAQLLRQLNRDEGLTVIAAVHDLNLAASYFERVIVMRDGRISADGTITDMMTTDRLSQTFGVPLAHVAHPTSGRPQFLGIDL
ncbi:MAG: iron ABC transporter ATP-binding protein [Myxococcales bacterium]|nr:iron ABC transporter ATP-binding protein [Myxococcales bacterium]|tara:strand:- start:86 stop:850 length:765 start_codon:yes stop_codon:yes gene_type:complete